MTVDSSSEAKDTFSMLTSNLDGLSPILPLLLKGIINGAKQNKVLGSKFTDNWVLVSIHRSLIVTNFNSNKTVQIKTENLA